MSEQTTAVATRQQPGAVKKVEVGAAGLKAMLSRVDVQAQLKSILGENAGQFGSALVQITRGSYALQKCTAGSILGSAMQAAALDLSVDPNIGEAHLVPYADKCQLQIGYPGFIQLAQRSGQYKALGWKVVYDGEFISFNELTGELELDPSKKKSDLVIGYAAQFKLLNGFERASYWTMDRVRAHAGKYSQAYKKEKKDSPWFTNFDKMALKTVLKDLLKTWGPKSIKMQQALKLDQAVFKDIDSEPEYLDNPEHSDDDGDLPPVSKPVIGVKPPTLFAVGEGESKEEKPPLPETPKDTKLVELKALLVKEKVSESQLLDAIRTMGMADESLSSLDEIYEVQPSVIEACINGWKSISKRLKK